MARKNKRKSFHGSISRRWTMRTAALIGCFLFLLIVCLTLLTRHIVYDGVKQELTGRTAGFSQMYRSVLSRGDDSLEELSKTYTAAAKDDTVSVVFLDKENKVLAVSKGEPADYNGGTDVEQAAQEETDVADWTGTLPNGEYVTAVTRTLRGSDGSVHGSVRCVESLHSTSQTVLWVCLSMVAGSLILLGLVVLFNRKFARELTAPLKKLSFTANKIAQGDFNIRLENKKDDEIGELCDAINDMAVSLDTTENMKNDFISSVSHELRTPLTAIKGWAETMQSGDIDEQTYERGMSIIIRESERLSGIVEELLDFSRMQSGKMRTDMEKTDILDELGEAVYMFTDRAKAEGKFLFYHAPKTMSPIYGDLNRLRQVFVNILDNALKYTDAGGTVNVSAKEEDGFVYITVADNGCGIPAEHLPNVRHKFYKVNQTARGSGIGLALVDEIMALHAGGLEIDSHENLGTAVTVSLPTYENLQKQKAKLHK